MIIQDIEITGFDSPPEKGVSSGIVTLQAGTLRMNIPLTLPRHLEMTNTRDKLLVMSEALAAARRMPEYRGKNTLRFHPALLPHEMRRKA